MTVDKTFRLGDFFMNQKSSENDDVKGFNDSELEDIMNEIEHLEKEFVEGNSDSAPLKASDIPSDVTTPSEHQNVVGPVSPPLSLHSHPSLTPPEEEDHCHTSFDLKVQGNIGLSMSFCVGDQIITLKVEDHGLHIELGNGAKFSIPLDEFKKSA